MRDKQPCGCIHDGVHWTSLCEPHATENAAIETRWAADYYRTARFDPERTRLQEPVEDWLA